MRLYHATTATYAPGQVVGPFAATHFFGAMASANRAWLETVLEAGRGDRRPSRTVAVYALTSPGACGRYLSAQKAHGIGSHGTQGTGHIYEIAMAHPRPAPMAIVGRIDRLGFGHAAIPRAVAEYWDPQDSWNVLEYLAETFTVIAEIPAPDAIALKEAYSAYERDWRHARERFV